MDERKKTFAAITILVGFGILVIILIGVFLSSRKVVSPVPEDGAIRIIFVTPTPTVVDTPTPTETPPSE